jgi:dolichol-phosphate mannosyltransferase
MQKLQAPHEGYEMISIVICTYKEQKTLSYLLPQLQKLLSKEDRIILVDDTKDFETQPFQSSQVLCFPIVRKKRGFGESLKQGLMIATFVLHSDWIIQMDADHTATDVNKLIGFISSHKAIDLLIGREIWNKKILGKEYRRFSSEFASFLSRHLLGLNVHQPTCGFRLYRKEILEQVNWKKIKAKGFDVEIELLWMLKWLDAEVAEIEIVSHKRKHDKSKQGFKQKITFLWMIARMTRKDLYARLRDRF